MLSRFSAVSVALAATVAAQTYSDCNPLKVSPSTCTPNPAFGGSVAVDFTKGGSTLFTASTGTNVKYGANGAEVIIDATGQAPTFSSTKYMFFGTVDVKLRVAKGQGIITTIVLESDVLDEIDWEWRGSYNGAVQSNYFSKGDTSTYGKLEKDISIPGGDGVDTFHTYTLDWTSEKLEWKIDGTSYRTLTYAGNEATYPQTPMKVKFGTWCAGCSSAAGTVEWAGGAPDWSQAPFTAYYQSIDIKDDANGVADAVTYQYTDQTGNMSSIKVNTGSTSNSASDTNSVSTVSTSSGAQSTPTPLSTATGAGISAATLIGQVAGAVASGVSSNSTSNRATGAAASATISSGASIQTSSIVTAGAPKAAGNFAFLGAAMFALSCL